MKKNGCRAFSCPAPVIKCLLLMKLTVLLICFFSFQSIAHVGFAQEKVTLKLANASLRTAFKIIERQTYFRFVYNEEILPAEQKININVQSEPVSNVLKQLLNKTELTFKIVGNDLIVISTEQKNAAEERIPLAFEVTGRVSDARNNPLPNVTVQEKGTSIGTSTKEHGVFTINVSSEKAVLVISSVGYLDQEIPVKGRHTIDVVMQDNVADLNQVVVIGYGTQKKADVTGSVVSVPKARLSELPVTNVYQAMQGAVAGLNITQNSSVPGSGATVTVRGINSVNANRTPFIVVDGIPFSTTGGNINDINSNDIASIEVLKDASAVAIYGTRGANGVILITTKRGTTGKPLIRYNGYTGMENLGHIMKPNSPEGYVQKYADWWKQVNPTQTQTQVLPNAYEVANYNAGKTVDWIKEETQQGIIQDHNVSVAGGTKDVRYYLSGEYLNQKGVVKGYQYKRLSVRSNLDVNLTDFLTVGTSLFYANNNYDGGRANFYLGAIMSPYGTLRKASGDYEIYPMNPELLYTNPLLGLYTDRTNRGNNLNGTFYLELKPAIVPGLKYRANAAYSYLPRDSANYVGRKANDQLGTAFVSNAYNKNWLFENILTYTKDFGKHHIDLTGLYSAQQNDFFGSSTVGTGFVNDDLSYKNLSAAATLSAGYVGYFNGANVYGSYQTRSTLISQMGRLNYNYDSRYLFTVTARRDGYSAFGANTDKYGLFPSFAVGWNLSNEKFMSSLSFVNNLKLRVSYGKSGNQAVDPNGTAFTDAPVRVPYNGISTIGVVTSNTMGNKDLHWETTKGFNTGVDFSVLNNRITGTIEYYITRTEDILLKRNLPTATGYQNVWDNLGKLANHGLEISLNTINVKAGDFKWETMLNFARNRNKILDLYGDKKDDLGNRWFIGQPLFVIYDYVLQGVWQQGEDATSQDNGAKPGDLKFADKNGSKTITADDKRILGSPLPKWIGGLTNTFHYKNWHLNIFIQTFQGAIKNNVNLTWADEAGRMNTAKEIGYWTADNKSNTRPSLAYTNSRGYGYASNNSYTRIKDVTLSYTTPQRLLTKSGLGNLTFYLSGRNLYTFTNWVGWDPENDFTFRGNGGWDNNYPLVRSFIFGVNVGLR
ncbi:SusC/RagA family TonB-linked outer membrane protein [Niastella koreensis]|uniref:TonB-dependent receptor plug n=3 Tax=Niastella koreensis TaxID=354356 RepID=G8TH52_NIAKG|nr:TonB-dependent receptor plug [Niastella koreensis GR20-10]OQP42294.1 SusC/RagA family TonB-linked outer membrane protein [Niastella koreensis]